MASHNPPPGSTEFRGVPIAYRQDDGSETPATAVDAAYQRGHHPQPQEEEAQDSDYPNAYVYTANPANAAPPAGNHRTSLPTSQSNRSRNGGGDNNGHPTSPAPTARVAETAASHPENPEEPKYDPVVKPLLGPLQQPPPPQPQGLPPATAAGAALPSASAYPPGLHYTAPPPPPGYTPQYLSAAPASATSPSQAPQSYNTEFYNTQSQPYSPEYFVPPPTVHGPHFAASQQLEDFSESPFWKTGLFNLGDDMKAALDAFLCGYCLSSAHFNRTYHDRQGLYAPMAAGLFCVDCCWWTETCPYTLPWPALVVHTFAIRRELRKRYGMSGNPALVKEGQGVDGEANREGATATAGEATDATDTAAHAHLDREPQNYAPNTATAAAAAGAPPLPSSALDHEAYTLDTPSTSQTAHRAVEAQVSNARGGGGGDDENVEAHIIPKSASRSESGSIMISRANTTATAEATPAPPQAQQGGNADSNEVQTIVASSPQQRFRFDAPYWLETGLDFAISLFCVQCAMAQHHREMSLRGDWPGAVVFSQECYCAPPQATLGGVQMTTMI